MDFQGESSFFACLNTSEDRDKMDEEENEETNNTENAKKITRKRYNKQMIAYLLDVIEELLPFGNKEWELVAMKFNQHFSVSFLR
jgi:hypothetical protein